MELIANSQVILNLIFLYWLFFFGPTIVAALLLPQVVVDGFENNISQYLFDDSAGPNHVLSKNCGRTKFEKRNWLIFFAIHFLRGFILPKILQYFLQFSFSNFYMMSSLIIFVSNLTLSVSSKMYKIFFKPTLFYTDILMKTFDLWSIHECNEREK